MYDVSYEVYDVWPRRCMKEGVMENIWKYKKMKTTLSLDVVFERFNLKAAKEKYLIMCRKFTTFVSVLR